MSLMTWVAVLAVETAAPPCQVSGHITASTFPLPGVSLAVSDGSVDVATSSTDLDGMYRVVLPGPGHYALKATLSGFAEATHEVELADTECAKTLDFTLGLRSRAAATPVPTTPPASPAPTTATASSPSRPPARPGTTPGAAGAAGRFRDLSVAASATPAEGSDARAAESAEAAQALAVPQGFSMEAPAESVTSTGGPVEVADSSFFRDRMEMLEAAGGDLEAMGRRLSMGLDPSGTGTLIGSGGGFGGGGFGGGGFGGGGFGGGGGGFFGGMGGGRGGGERLQGNLSHTLGGSLLDAAPYTLSGRETTKADYTQQRVSANLTGPVKLPGVYDGTSRTRFTLSYSGSWDHRPYDAYSTVPTDAERAGDLSTLGRSIYDPTTGALFADGVIPASRIDPAALALLDFIPLPNLPGDTQNFHFVTANRNHSDSITLNLSHRFGAVGNTNRAGARRTGGPNGNRSANATAGSTSGTSGSSTGTTGGTSSGSSGSSGSSTTSSGSGETTDASAGATTDSSASTTASTTASTDRDRERDRSGDRAAGERGGRGGQGGLGGFGGRGGGLGGRRGGMPMGRRTPTLNLSLSYGNNSSHSAGRFPTLGGDNDGNSLSSNLNLSWGIGRTMQQTRVTFSRNRSNGLNLYAFTRDVAGEAGVVGISDDPFDWGVPNLSFTTFADLSDRAPSRRVDRRWSVGHTATYALKKHTLRVGAELRSQSLDSQVDTNARGSFTFTGLYTSRPGGGAARDGGLDFADFLLGYPQQASVQYGPGEIGFRSRSYNLYFADDWRVTGGLTVNAGLRYEFASPLDEAQDHLVNLDVPSDFSAAAPVMAGKNGPFTGAFPDSLVYADRNNVAPRIGVAWTPNRSSSRRLTIRGGYGVNYNLGAYSSIAQRLAGQPPFAVSNTSQGSPLAPLTFASPFVVVSDATVTNSYGIDKHYQLGAVQIWNLDLQRELPHGWTVGGGYTGTAGRNLDIQRAPNRDRNGLRIPNVQAFLWQSSEGSSITHSGTLRIRKRMARGFFAGLNYTLAKSLDNASSIGGGGFTVAQDDRNLAAERGRSSFDRRHRLLFNYQWELPFGPSRTWLQKGFWSAIAGGWTWSGSGTYQSGAPFTARVRGDFADVQRGVNGTLRADYTGAPITVDDPTVERWFNTAAFVLPPAGQFGNAGRNTITGPSSLLVNMNLSRNVSLGRPRSLNIQIQVTNVLNTPNYGSIDTVVNSPTFGQVTSVGQMRSAQVTTRLRF
jgi:hypothetical protein